MIRWLLGLPHKHLNSDIFFEIEEELGFIEALVPHFDKKSLEEKAYILIPWIFRLALKVAIISARFRKKTFRQQYQEHKPSDNVVFSTAPITIGDAIRLAQTQNILIQCQRVDDSTAVIHFGNNSSCSLYVTCSDPRINCCVLSGVDMDCPLATDFSKHFLTLLNDSPRTSQF